MSDARDSLVRLAGAYQGSPPSWVAVVHVKCGDEDFTLVADGKECRIEDGKVGQATAALELPEALLVAITSGDGDGELAYLRGDLRVTGKVDDALAMFHRDIVSAVER